jgi:hypothetical protein
MTVQTWLEWAVDDARRRSLDDAVPVLEALAKAAAALREAERTDIDAPGDTPSEPGNDDA